MNEGPPTPQKAKAKEIKIKRVLVMERKSKEGP